ncbi:4-alpha-glucanotransferase [Alphaproteobacteria bacterium KMM 3653]|uniref:4-alpha-glucanotransferase n=1 Tax=Harenicola maris TaxID=2841044 RepID=A0AAP2CLR1_9RHOB|nr:4-alpha-glucanotransferase [Harenicola maris]
MSADHTLAQLAEVNGILPRFHGLDGREHATSPDTLRALLIGNGTPAATEHEAAESLAAHHAEAAERWFPHQIIVTSGQEAPQNFGLGCDWHITPDGADTPVAQGRAEHAITLPPLPSGVYTLTASASGRTEHITVLAAPARLPTARDLTGHERLWGMTAALYGLRSARNSGLGDFADLGALGRELGHSGAGFIGINPVHNMGWADGATSPYSPSHRGFLNTGYIALDQIPGVPAPQGDFAAIRAYDTVQYAAHQAAHQAALNAAYDAFLAHATADQKSALAAFTAKGGEDLARFARFEALSETHGPDWRHWPADPEAPAPSRAAFHIFLQWVTDTQLAAAQSRAKGAGMALGLYLDLAVGPRRGGAESWCEGAAIAQGVSVGAPPDHLSPGGQNWDLAAYAPRKLAALNYRPLRRLLAATMRHAGVIRIDHVLGLNRSFWIPDDGSAGGYIRQPFEALLAVIKIEAERMGCAVIGEDLGLVPEGFRETMTAHGFYGYSVLQYEKHGGHFHPPGEDRPQVLSCFATHDTPTAAGYAAGRDIDWWERLGWTQEEGANHARTERKNDVADLMALSPAEDFAASVHTTLAHSPARMVCAQLDDVLGHTEAQNLPGTVTEHPNWQRKYAAPVEGLAQNPALAHLAKTMQDAGRNHPTPPEKETRDAG